MLMMHTCSVCNYWKIQVGVCSMFLETLPLCQTNISNFPHTISDLNTIKKVASAKKRKIQFQAMILKSVENLTWGIYH